MSLNDEIYVAERRAYDTGEDDGYQAGRRDERAACAELVRAAGCQCIKLGGAVWGLPSGRGVTSPGLARDRPVKTHDLACPTALAAAIEARGKEGG